MSFLVSFIDLETGKLISLEILRNVIQIFDKDDKKVNFKDSSIRMISGYNIKQTIIDDKFKKDSYYNSNLDEKEFSDLVSGKNTYEVLSSKNLVNKKRENVELFSNLYLMMGGNEDGLSRENLAKCLALSQQIIEDPTSYLTKSEVTNDSTYYSIADDIIKTLSRNNTDKISPEDFINIMTYNEI